MINKISFQGKTEFCISPTAYRKVEKLTRKAHTDLYNDCNTKIHNTHTYSLHTDPEFLTVAVKNEDGGILKYVPLGKDIEELLDVISFKVEELKKTANKNPLTAWIIGGTKIEGKRGNLVVDTLNKIAERICDRSDIDTSILVGSKTGEDIFIIRSGKNQLKLALDKKVNTKNNLQSELENIYDIVELNNTTLSHAD